MRTIIVVDDCVAERDLVVSYVGVATAGLYDWRILAPETLAEAKELLTEQQATCLLLDFNLDCWSATGSALTVACMLQSILKQVENGARIYSISADAAAAGMLEAALATPVSLAAQKSTLGKQCWNDPKMSALSKALYTGK